MSDGIREERIAKVIARAGWCSRREAEKLIEAGKVAVNSKVITTPAIKVSEEDLIKIDGTALKAKEKTRVWALHKPRGVVTTNKDPQGRQTVFDILPKNIPRVISIGRLDINTEGLLLFTNDGEFSRYMELPSSEVIRRYRVKVFGRVTQKMLAKAKRGVTINKIFYQFKEIKIEKKYENNSWLNIWLQSGKNLEIRNVLESFGLTISRLIRISYGKYYLKGLEVGEIKEMKIDECG
jgi:23S rRNA pseudouridine2605 synthase